MDLITRRQIAWQASRGGACAVAFSLLSGCGSSGESNSANFDLLKLPELPSVGALTSSNDSAKGTATELYSRIATGANTCWFGAAGPLKKDYIYSADADAPSRGGKAEIMIHARDVGQPNPRGPKAFRISIVPKDETSAKVETENLKMTEPVAAAMTADVERWSKGEQGCKGKTTAAGWDVVAPPAPAAAAVAKPVKAAKKPAVKPTAPAVKPPAQ